MSGVPGNGGAPSRRAPQAQAVVARVLPWRKMALRQLPAALVLVVLGWLLADRFAALDTARIGTALKGVGLSQWALGALFTGISFWAVGRYDAVVHRLAGTGVPQAQAVASGAVAIAVSQTLGMGALTGGLVRWRLVPGLSLIGAMRVSISVALSFLAGWAVISAVALLVVPLPLPGARAGAVGVLALAGLAALASVLQPRLPRGLHMPPLKAMAVILGLAALDTLAAGTVLWVLLPPELATTPARVIAAYLLGLGAGLVLTTPGGVGPFEVTLLALLPDLPTEPLLATIIAYRALYYACPATLAGAILLRGTVLGRAVVRRTPEPARVTPLSGAPHLPFLLDAVIEAAPRAEAGLLRHGHLALLTDGADRPLSAAATSGQSLIVLGDPLRPDAAPGTVLDRASAAAAWSLRSPVLYKAGRGLALAARARGWVLTRVAEEAWLNPGGFSPHGSKYRQLRRKLRKAEAAGVTITKVAPLDQTRLPLDEMAEIAESWCRSHGGERGFSMGQWNRGALCWAHVCLARDPQGRLLGFITLHTNAQEHMLDLMRAAPDAPDGTMHALVAAAIASAAEAGVARFSLAAAPVVDLAGDRAPIQALRARFAEAAGAHGLRQFKATFAPHWEPLYLAAPNRASLVLGALDIAREIARPRPHGS